jgi:hypothetical protein
MKTRSDDEEPESGEAHEERHRCRDWLLRFMKGNQPKFPTKAELRNAAIRELNGVKELVRLCMD